MLRLLSLVMFLGLSFVWTQPATAAPQEDIAVLESKLQEIDSAGMPEEVKAKAREHIMREMEKAQKRQGGDGPKKPDAGKDKKKDDDKSKTVKRPDEPKEPADPKELEARPTNGRLILNFRGHPWPAMIDWYSSATGREVEWQELPNGFVNVRTERALTMKETGDLFNRMLLSHGFTMLDDGEFLQIVKMEGLNPAFVPRVVPKQLATMMPHSFARTSFQLNRFKAEEIVKELDAMKSKHGKLVAMSAANRIEAMDTVINLRDIFQALDQEQSSGHHKPREFEIEFVRADVVKSKLEEMLGIASQAKKGAMTPQQMQQMRQRQEQERQRQQQQKNKGGAPAGQPTPEKISMIVNDVKNSIIVKAPPHKMLDIADAIELLDVRPDGDMLDIHAYTLATRDPQELADMLKESGALSPTAMIRVDSKTKTLLISGNKFDHYRVKELIKSIDGNARRFVSVRLRRYPAAQVAGTIEKMMGEPKEENSRSRYRWWDYDEDEDNKSDKFHVTADVENNRLILKCNDSEYEMVMELLTQMGEVMTRSRYAMNEVVLEDLASEDVSEDEMLEMIKRAFEAQAPNAVILPPPKEKAEQPEQSESSSDADAETESSDAEEAVDIGSRTTSVAPRSKTQTIYTQLDLTDATVEPTETAVVERTSTEEADRRATRAPTAAKEPPPIVIERNAQGKLVIRSKDAAALELFEELLERMAPKREDWISFRMKHVSAYWMKTQLEDFFKDDDGSGPNYVFWDYWDYQRSQENKKGPGLGEAPKMRFIDDSESTLVVRNASAKQLATIKRLIELYDVAEPPNENNARYKKMIQIKFSKARVIETALKDAFRDLLSSNDKAFGEQKGEGERGGSRRFGFGFGFGSSDSDSGLGSGSTFKGKLSFGVDESTNTLIVTAQGKSLLNLVADMVDELDQAAVPSDDTRVVTLPAGLNSGSVRETLTKMFGAGAITTKPGNPDQKGQEGREGGEGERGNGDRRGRGRRGE